MLYYVFKVVLSACVIVAISEISKRNSGVAALLASLPLTSLLAFVWMRADGATDVQIGALSGQIFWLVLPSLVLFLAFTLLLKQGLNFWFALGLSALATALCYLAMLPVLRRFGVEL